MCQKMRGIVGLGVLATVLVPAVAGAQMVGLGARFSLVRGDAATGTPTTRFLGGSMRLKLSGNLSVEGAADYRTTWNAQRTQRIREAPIQGSVLLYPIRSILAPYVIGGVGIYTRNYDVVGAEGLVTETAQERKTGVHLGFGGELRLAKRVVAYLDYRYRFVTFGNDTTTAAGSTTSSSNVTKLLNSVPGLSRLGVAHQGSMWTGGVAFVF